jgi:hypothetical protein
MTIVLGHIVREDMRLHLIHFKTRMNRLVKHVQLCRPHPLESILSSGVSLDPGACRIAGYAGGGEMG